MPPPDRPGLPGRHRREHPHSGLSGEGHRAYRPDLDSRDRTSGSGTKRPTHLGFGATTRTGSEGPKAPEATVPGELEVWSTVHQAVSKPAATQAAPKFVRVRKRKQWAIHAAIVAAMVAGVTAFVSFDKTIELTVDGKTQKVHTFAGTVAGVLAREGITVTDH